MGEVPRSIEVRNLTRLYGGRLAVDSIGFEVRQGEAVGLLGPSGAGKTTVLRVLAGFVPPTSGEVRVAGLDVCANPLETQRRIGYLPELPPLYPEMSVRGFLVFAAALKGIPSPERKGAAEKAIERCGLKDVAARPIERLGRASRQRVGLAQAIVHEPDLLLLDEPTAGLDPPQVREGRDLVRQLAEGRTLLLTSRLVSEVEGTCQRVILMNKGKLVASDTPQGVQGRLRQNVKQRIWVEFAGPVDEVKQALSALPGVAAVERIQRLGTEQVPRIQCLAICASSGDYRNAVARCVIESRGELLFLREEQPSLEEVFAQLTTKGDSSAMPS